MFSIYHSGAMYGDETSARDSAIAALFSRCSSQFRNFYAAIVCKDRQTHQINLARLTGEFGRLGGWGGNSGADRMGRGSLDEKVRNDQNLKSVILNLLEDLYDTLERGKSFHDSAWATTYCERSDFLGHGWRWR